MTETENAILQTLLELDATVKTMATTHPKPELSPLFAKLDGLVAQLPKSTEPDLLHCLYKHSYEKARFILQGRAAENARGTC